MLKRIINFLFPVKNQEVPVPELTEPLVGEWFILHPEDTENPFAVNQLCAVRIKSVKSGYVLYALAPFRGLWQNESMSIERFLSIYRSATQEEAELLASKYL